MNKNYVAEATTTIHAPVSKVWQALVNPELIKQYLFNTEVISDWKVGSPIIYKGEWEGKAFEDKGKILEIEPEKILRSTHWSPLSGAPDSPENYHTVIYSLSDRGDSTEVTIKQDNNASEDEKAHAEKNWKSVLEGMKNLLER
ncbi:MAG TPA: SRPBCC domain-containing protein [Anaerolineales bacterium]|jgi:uncharacterized protein YndB with AHSA1/START domain|nr:SRPBCC domain-containing protein [Anaerolineales bacterium]